MNNTSSTTYIFAIYGGLKLADSQAEIMLTSSNDTDRINYRTLAKSTILTTFKIAMEYTSEPRHYIEKVIQDYSIKEKEVIKYLLDEAIEDNE